MENIPSGYCIIVQRYTERYEKRYKKRYKNDTKITKEKLEDNEKSYK